MLRHGQCQCVLEGGLRRRLLIREHGVQPFAHRTERDGIGAWGGEVQVHELQRLLQVAGCGGTLHAFRRFPDERACTGRGPGERLLQLRRAQLTDAHGLHGGRRKGCGYEILERGQ